MWYLEKNISEYIYDSKKKISYNTYTLENKCKQKLITIKFVYKIHGLKVFANT